MDEIRKALKDKAAMLSLLNQMGEYEGLRVVIFIIVISIIFCLLKFDTFQTF